MAEGFVEFSAALYYLTDTERTWCTQRLHSLEESSSKENDSLGWLGFEWSVENTDDGEKMLWLRAAHDGNIERVTSFVQAFLRKYRPTDYFILTYAETCDKLRIGEFGGGAVFVTAERIERWSAHQWLQNQVTHFKEAQT